MDTTRLVPGQGVARNVDLAMMRARLIASRVNPGRGGVSTTQGIANLRAENFKNAPYPVRGGPPKPFTITPVPGAAKVTIYPGDVDDGFVGGIVPKIGGVFINDATPPELTVVSGSVYLRATKDSAGRFTDLEVLNAASLPANTSTYAYRQLGTVSVSGTVVTKTAQTVENSLSHRVCAGNSTWGISG